MPRDKKNIKKEEAEDKEANEGDDEEALTYELGYLVVPTVAEEALSEQVGLLRSSIERGSSVPFSEEFPSRRTLAYCISRSVGGRREKYNEAYFGWVKFDALPGRIDAIKKGCDENDNILRYLIVKVPQDRSADKVSTVRPILSRKKRADTTALKTTKDLSDKKPENAMSDEELNKTLEELIGE